MAIPTPPSFDVSKFLIDGNSEYLERAEWFYPEIWDGKIQWMLLWYEYLAQLAKQMQAEIESAAQQTTDRIAQLLAENNISTEALVAALAAMSMPVPTDDDIGKSLVWTGTEYMLIRRDFDVLDGGSY